MRKYVIDSRTMLVGYLENNEFYPLAIYLPTGICGMGLVIENLDLEDEYEG